MKTPDVSDPLTFLIVEDEADVGEGIAHLLAPFGTATVCGTLADSLKAIAERAFDGAVIDIVLPDGSGLAVLDVLRSEQRDTPVLVLTGTNVDKYQQHTMLAQALYLPKPATPAHVLSFVRWVRKWKGLEQRDIRQIVLDFAQKHQLPAQQAEVIQLAARGMLRDEIARELGISLNTLKTHIMRILETTGYPSIRRLVCALHGARAEENMDRLD